ncbi:MAG: acyltransferase family protein [Pirellulaceae bacterium]
MSDSMRLQPAQPLPSTQASASANRVPPRRAPERLASLDAYRGFIMIMLAASGFGIARLARLPEDAPVWQSLDFDVWQQVSFHFAHPAWISRFGWIGISFWDLIQPAFMFMVGVAMPYSYARREALGHSLGRRLLHAVWRGLVLVLLGVFLQSQRTPSTNWIFPNVLSQIGLGYVFLYLLMGRRLVTQVAALIAILGGCWLFFFLYTAPEGYDFAAVQATEETVLEGRFGHWSKNDNMGHRCDVWLLNQFPRPHGERFEFNSGGYVTLNFVPSIATMLLGVLCGQLLRSRWRSWLKLLVLIAAGAGCLGLGVAAGEWICPVVKRIWTPSWVLFSGGWVIWMLAAFYLVFDLCRLRWLAFPLIVVGMNSIVMYMMGQLMRPWCTKMVHVHLGSLLEWAFGPELLADDMFGRIADPTAALMVFWLIAFWLYRKKFFVRV